MQRRHFIELYLTAVVFRTAKLSPTALQLRFIWTKRRKIYLMTLYTASSRPSSILRSAAAAAAPRLD